MQWPQGRAPRTVATECPVAMTRCRLRTSQFARRQARRRAARRPCPASVPDALGGRSVSRRPTGRVICLRAAPMMPSPRGPGAQFSGRARMPRRHNRPVQVHLFAPRSRSASLRRTLTLTQPSSSMSKHAGVPERAPMSPAPVVSKVVKLLLLRTIRSAIVSAEPGRLDTKRRTREQ